MDVARDILHSYTAPTMEFHCQAEAMDESASKVSGMEHQGRRGTATGLERTTERQEQNQTGEDETKEPMTEK